MIQTVIALFIVALALAWTLMRIIKGTKNPSCNCGCDHCPSSKKTTCPHPKAK
ncbi:MAG: FeoB-associated Cys-rich membrane protein [Muribaculaceae bacterium]|nr:FeoB-associated Cys-rich membrane protein [Muribaculaceae bacterium]